MQSVYAFSDQAKDKDYYPFMKTRKVQWYEWVYVFCTAPIIWKQTLNYIRTY